MAPVVPPVGFSAAEGVTFYYPTTIGSALKPSVDFCGNLPVSGIKIFPRTGFVGEVTMNGHVAFIVTLATLNVMYGLAGIICEGFPIANAFPAWFLQLGIGRVGVVPIPAIILIVVFLLAHFLMTYTTTGRSIYAIGGNTESARLSGINVFKTKIIVFASVQVMCVLAAFMHSAQVASGSYSFGKGWEVDVISAVVIGGTIMAFAVLMATLQSKAKA